MIKKVMFVGRATAETTPGWSDWAIISISEPDSASGEAKLMGEWHSVHRLDFHDIETEIPGKNYLLMTQSQRKQIVDFVHKVAPEVQGIVVHCPAGISRSAAVAKWIAEVYDLPFNHEYDRFNKHVYNLLVEACHYSSKKAN